MKYAVLVCRLLLGLVFLVAGANHVVPFLPMQAIPGDAGVFATILITHKYFAVIGLLEVIGGLLLLVGRFVPLGLVILIPITVNIFLFSTLLAPQGIPVAIIVIAMELFLLFVYRNAFAGLLSAGPEVLGSPKL
jgi:putative oxidoreductase